MQKKFTKKYILNFLPKPADRQSNKIHLDMTISSDQEHTVQNSGGCSNPGPFVKRFKLIGGILNLKFQKILQISICFVAKSEIF